MRGSHKALYYVGVEPAIRHAQSIGCGDLYCTATHPKHHNIKDYMTGEGFFEWSDVQAAIL